MLGRFICSPDTPIGQLRMDPRHSQVVSRPWRYDLGRLHSRLIFLPRFSETMRRQAHSAHDRGAFPWDLLGISPLSRHKLHFLRYTSFCHVRRVLKQQPHLVVNLSRVQVRVGGSEGSLGPRGRHLRSIRHRQPFPISVELLSAHP